VARIREGWIATVSIGSVDILAKCSWKQSSKEGQKRHTMVLMKEHMQEGTMAKYRDSARAAEQTWE